VWVAEVRVQTTSNRRPGKKCTVESLSPAESDSLKRIHLIFLRLSSAHYEGRRWDKDVPLLQDFWTGKVAEIPTVDQYS